MSHQAHWHVSVAAANAAGRRHTWGALPAVNLHTGQQRHGPLTPPASPPWQVEAAILKLHSRRVCCLAFPDNTHRQTSHASLDCDHRGHAIAQRPMWEVVRVHDRTTYSNIHRALVNSIRFASWLPGGFSCASASSDGTVKLFDIETGRHICTCAKRAAYMPEYKLAGGGAAIWCCSSSQLLDLNPGGWSSGVTWHMFYGADVNQELRLVLAGDSDGRVHLLDPRAAGGALNTLQLHKPGSKVNSVAVNPAGGASVVLTAEDTTALVPQPTAADRRACSRYLTPFKAEWFPTDPSECRIICGRYISEDFGGVALHPVDIIDAASGRLLQQLTDLNLNTITPVNLPHPRLDVIISGSSRSLYKWVPRLDDEDADSIEQRTGRSGSSAAAAADLVRRAAASSNSFVCVDAEPGGKGSKATSSGSKTVTKSKQAAAGGTNAAGGKRKAAALSNVSSCQQCCSLCRLLLA
ncbi:hypothetical protein COO60DRAFT_1625186 [Scenedesmus sp. NREL 46B-D3]|nr:hypothetical protein COO60DRAFT_1625186 [Scenedesmus sp. NREL 46B-D3]